MYDERVQEQLQRQSLRQLVYVLAQMLHQELGMRIVVWHVGAMVAKEATRAQHVAENAAGMQKHARRTLQTTSAKQLQQILTRIVKGDLETRILIWRTEVRRVIHQMAVEIQAEETFDLLTHIQASFIRRLLQIFTGISKGELAMRILVWSQQVITRFGLCPSKEGVDKSVQADLMVAHATGTSHIKLLSRVSHLKVLASLIEVIDAPRLQIQLRLTYWRLKSVQQGNDKVVESKFGFGLFTTRSYVT